MIAWLRSIALLSAPLTGTKADADQRVTLRAERDVLTGKARMIAHQNLQPPSLLRGIPILSNHSKSWSLAIPEPRTEILASWNR